MSAHIPVAKATAIPAATKPANSTYSMATTPSSFLFFIPPTLEIGGRWLITKIDEFADGDLSYIQWHVRERSREKQALNVTTASLFGLAFWRLGFVPELPAVLAFIFGGVLLSVIDWKVHRLPTKVVYYTLAGVAAGLLFASIVERDWVPLATAALGAVLFANVFFLIYFLGRNVFGMMVLGFGDVRLAAVLGCSSVGTACRTCSTGPSSGTCWPSWWWSPRACGSASCSCSTPSARR